MGKGQTLDIEYMISNYRLWKREIARLERVLYGGHRSMSSWGVAQYGDIAAMPKGSSIRSAKELERMDYRDRIQYARLTRLESYVFALEVGIDVLKGEEIRTIYDCLLEGWTYRDIADHLNIAVSSVHRKRKKIVEQMEQNERIRAILTYEKNVS